MCCMAGSVTAGGKRAPANGKRGREISSARLEGEEVKRGG
jgi:hypothetical protein